jgi:drug/metabolite transporter (DMT)-like permease
MVGWVGLALVAAIGTTARETLIKSVMRAGDEVALGFVAAAVSAVLLSCWLLATGGLAWPRPAFVWALLMGGGINAIAAVLIARAVHVSDLSLVSPLQSTTPVFMIGTGALLLGEVPPRAGIAGILVITIGTYVLATSRQPTSRSALAPFAALAADRGARLFLLVAAMYGVAAAIDKVGVIAASPALWATAVNIFVASLLLAVLVRRGEVGRVPALIRRAPRRVLGSGALMAVVLAAQMTALPLTLAAYVIAVKRTSVLFSVLSGGVVFRERGIGRRLAGAGIMLVGLVLITVVAA